MEGLIIIAALVVLIFYIWAAVEFGNVAVEKGHSDKKGTIIAFCIFAPVAGYLLACALPNVNGQSAVNAPKIEEKTDDSDELPEL